MNNTEQHTAQDAQRLLAQSEREDLILGIKAALEAIRVQNRALSQTMDASEYRIMTEGIAVTVESLQRLIGNCGALADSEKLA